MLKTYIVPKIFTVQCDNDILSGSITATAPDMEFDCGCGCNACNKGNHHPQTYSVTGGYCDYWDDLNIDFDE